MDHETLVYRMEYASDYAADIARHIVMLSGTRTKDPGRSLGAYDKRRNRSS